MNRCFRCGRELDRTLCMACTITSQKSRERLADRPDQAERDIQQLLRELDSALPIGWRAGDDGEEQLEER